MKASTVFLTIICIGIFFPPAVGGHLENCVEVPLSGVSIWKSDPQMFNITSVELHPVFTASGLPIFGDIYITWMIEGDNGVFPVFAYFQQGKLVNIRVFGLSTSASWFVAGTEILLVQSFAQTSKLIWFSSLHEEKSLELDVPIGIVNARLLFDSANLASTRWEIQIRENSTAPLFSGEWGILGSLEFNTAQKELLSSWIFSGLYLNLSSGEVYLENSERAKILNEKFTKPELYFMGYNLDNIYNPDLAIVDGQNVYSISNESYIKTKGEINAVYNFGLTSSIFNFPDGFYEYYGGEWQKLPYVSDIATDLMFFDINLYVGVDVFEGLRVRYYGEDEDGDGIPSVAETYYASDPTLNDTDGDGIGDGFEVGYGLSPSVDDSDLDYDGDGLSNYDEYLLGLDPLNPDSDFGGANDGFEEMYGFDPCQREDDGSDPDGDGLSNAVESTLRSSPINPDTDSDGISDGNEFLNNLNLLDPSDAELDYDGDGISNLQEIIMGTDPFSKDSQPPLSDLWIWIVLVGILMSAFTFTLLRKRLQGFLNY